MSLITHHSLLITLHSLKVYLHLPEHLTAGEEIRRAEDRFVGMLVEEIVAEDRHADRALCRQREVVADTRVEQRVAGNRMLRRAGEAGANQRPVDRIVVAPLPRCLD